MSTTTAQALPVSIARHGGTWFTYDADGFVVEAGLGQRDAEDAVEAAKHGMTREEYEEADRREWEERMLRLTRTMHLGELD